MSLELAIEENTAVMKQLIAVLSTAVEAGAVTAPSGETPDAKRKRRTKAEIEADRAAEAHSQVVEAQAQVVEQPVAAQVAEAHQTVQHDGYTTTPVTNPGGTVNGDPVGTRYFHLEKHNTVFAQRPGDPDVPLEAKITTAAEYLRLKAEYAKKTAAIVEGGVAQESAPSVSNAPSPTSVATAPTEVTMATITAKLMTIHKRDGNQGVAPILAKFGVANVPALGGKNLVEVDAAVEAVLNPSANLFG